MSGEPPGQELLCDRGAEEIDEMEEEVDEAGRNEMTWLVREGRRGRGGVGCGVVGCAGMGGVGGEAGGVVGVERRDAERMAVQDRRGSGREGA